MRPVIRTFVEAAVQAFPGRGPVLEFGAFRVEGQERLADLRPLFGNRPYLGLDLRPGPGVDRVEDVSAPTLPDGSAETLLCLETLEHVFEVRRAFEHLHRLLSPGGVLIASAPFHFHIHAHPDDYWRLTPSAWRRLLEPFALRLVVALGPAQRPHSVLALAQKAPLSADGPARAQALAADYALRLAELPGRPSALKRMARAARGLLLTRGERRARAEALHARVTLDVSAAPGPA